MEQHPIFKEEVEITLHKEKICLRATSGIEKEVARMGMGKRDEMYGVWYFPFTKINCYLLVKKFKENMKSCHRSIIESASDYYSTMQLKESEDLPDIPKLLLPAWKHQRQCYHFGKDLPAFYIAMGMGCGKTMTTIGLLQDESKNDNCILIVTPKSVLDVWPSEFKKHAVDNFYITVLKKGTAKEKAKFAQSEMKKAKALKEKFVLIVNYDTIWREPLGDFIRNVQWTTIIYDEAHKIKSHSGTASNFCAKLVFNSERRIALSGTPMPHSPADIYGQFRALDPTIFGRTWTGFKGKYLVLGGPTGNIVVGFKNLLELNSKFESISYKVGSEILDLPEKVVMQRFGELEPAQRKHYKEMFQELCTSVSNGELTAANAMVKFLRLQQIVTGHITLDNGDQVVVGNAKQELLKETLQEIDKDEPVVLFGVFKRDIAIIKEVCAELGRTCAELSGSDNQLKDWQDGKYNAIAVNIQSGGVGIDLTRSRYSIYFTIGYSLGAHDQSIARIHRPGQKKTSFIIYLMMKDTVDERIFKALESKREIVEYALEGIKEDLGLNN